MMVTCGFIGCVPFYFSCLDMQTRKRHKTTGDEWGKTATICQRAKANNRRYSTAHMVKLCRLLALDCLSIEKMGCPLGERPVRKYGLWERGEATGLWHVLARRL